MSAERNPSVDLILERAAWEIDADPREGLPGRRLGDDARRLLAADLDAVRADFAELIDTMVEARIVLDAAIPLACRRGGDIIDRIDAALAAVRGGAAS